MKTSPSILVLPELTPAMWGHLRAAELESLKTSRVLQSLRQPSNEPEEIAADHLRFDTDTAIENLMGDALVVIEWAYRLETAAKRPRAKLRANLLWLMRGRKALALSGMAPLTWFNASTPLFVLRDAILAESNLGDRPRFKLINRLTDLIASR